MTTDQLLTYAKQVICALLALILPWAGVGLPSLGLNGSTETEAVRIMSFNVRDGEFDREEIVPQVIADYMPDSVGLQECEGTWYLTLKTYLPDYTIVGVGRLTGLPLIGESTAIMFRNDKYKLVDSGTFWLSETPFIVSKGWDANYPRTCTWVVLENLETGEQYAHVNTHLDNGGSLAREKGLEMVLEKAASFDMPVVITGDFNLGKNSELYNFMTSGEFSDVAEIAVSADAGGTAHGYGGGIGTNPIDFILSNDKVDSVLTYRIMREKYNDRYPSDHYPIYSDMIF